MSAGRSSPARAPSGVMIPTGRSPSTATTTSTAGSAKAAAWSAARPCSTLGATTSRSHSPHCSGFSRRRATSAAAAGSIGAQGAPGPAKNQPCASGTPSCMQCRASASVSIPSASTHASMRFANTPSISTSALFTSSRSTSATSARSSFSTDGRKARICCSPAYPAPASSTAISAPRRRRRSSPAATAFASPSSRCSVTSTTTPPSGAWSRNTAMTSGDASDSGSTLTVRNVFAGSDARCASAAATTAASSCATRPRRAACANHTSGVAATPWSNRARAS